MKNNLSQQFTHDTLTVFKSTDEVKNMRIFRKITQFLTSYINDKSKTKTHFLDSQRDMNNNFLNFDY